MSATQRLNTGRSSQFADTGGGGGVSMADVLIQKPFFTAQGLLPSGTIREDLYNFPAPDFSNPNGGVFSRTRSRAKFVPDGVHFNAANFGWDLGGTFGKVLMVMGMNRPRQNAQGLFIATAPLAAPAPTSCYAAYMDNFGGNCAIYSISGGGVATLLASDSTNLMQDDYKGADVAMALYADGATVIFFLRRGSGTWYPVVEVADASFGAFQSAGVAIAQVSSTYWFGCPIGVYAE